MKGNSEHGLVGMVYGIRHQLGCDRVQREPAAFVQKDTPVGDERPYLATGIGNGNRFSGQEEDMGMHDHDEEPFGTGLDSGAGRLGADEQVAGAADRGAAAVPGWDSDSA
ncbi:hypothetical protein [Streptomyces sp. NRRL WC-3742]|uniref:hypothetical protein n=1 Tax=Streptomyces sp. NRRL WC-3742 TaxID=1463934 RepID=UPI00131E3D4A|nr:hypothetical protein [Streptomyces sp. NRRL WC-3742]